MYAPANEAFRLRCVFFAGGLNWEELRSLLNELHPQRQNDITEGEVRMSRSRQRGRPAERQADTKTAAELGTMLHRRQPRGTAPMSQQHCSKLPTAPQIWKKV
jgi:hypothetical protein